MHGVIIQAVLIIPFHAGAELHIPLHGHKYGDIKAALGIAPGLDIKRPPGIPGFVLAVELDLRPGQGIVCAAFVYIAPELHLGPCGYRQGQGDDQGHEGHGKEESFHGGAPWLELSDKVIRTCFFGQVL